MASASGSVGHSQAADDDFSDFMADWETEIDPGYRELIMVCETPPHKRKAGMKTTGEMTKIRQGRKTFPPDPASSPSTQRVEATAKPPSNPMRLEKSLRGREFMVFRYKFEPDCTYVFQLPVLKKKTTINVRAEEAASKSHDSPLKVRVGTNEVWQAGGSHRTTADILRADPAFDDDFAPGGPQEQHAAPLASLTEVSEESDSQGSSTAQAKEKIIVGLDRGTAQAGADKAKTKEIV